MSFLSRGERTPADPWTTLVSASDRYIAAANASAERGGWLRGIRLGLRTTELMDAAAGVIPEHPTVLAWQAPDGTCSNMAALEIADMVRATAATQDALPETLAPHGGATYVEGAV